MLNCIVIVVVVVVFFTNQESCLMPVDFLTPSTCRRNVKPNFVCFISHKRRQRHQLFVWVQEQREELCPNYEDEELLQTEQCLDEVNRMKL